MIKRQISDRWKFKGERVKVESNCFEPLAFSGQVTMDIKEITAKLPGKDCGLCGFKTCRELAEIILHDTDAIKRCIFIETHKDYQTPELTKDEITWKDILDREYDFVLQKYPEDPGPREIILPFNPANVEKLKIKKGDVLYGRPASTGCPVAHVGLVMEEPDYFNGLVVWCVVGPIHARERGVNVGCYTPVAYEGLVKHARVDLQIGRRYYFLPRYCMLQSRHSGLINAINKTKDGFLRVRLEAIWIG